MHLSDDLRKLHEAATPGPWLTQDERDGMYAVWTRQPHIGTLALCQYEDINGEFPAKDNAALIVAMRNALPDLLDTIDRLTRERDEAREAAPMAFAEGLEVGFQCGRANEKPSANAWEHSDAALRIAAAIRSRAAQGEG